MLPLKNPSRIVHAVWAYWLTSRDGSSGNAQTQQANALVSRARTLVRAFRARGRTPEVIFGRVPPCFGLIMESDNPNAGATLSVSDLPTAPPDRPVVAKGN